MHFMGQVPAFFKEPFIFFYKAKKYEHNRELFYLFF